MTTSAYSCDKCGETFDEVAVYRGHMSGHSRGYTQAEMIEYGQELAEELGRAPTGPEMNDYGGPSATTCKDHFGSWNGYLDACGLEPHHRKDWTREKLIAEMQRVGGEIERTPSASDLQEYGRAGVQAFQNEFGKLTVAQRAAGFEPNSFQNPDHTRQSFSKERLIRDLQEYAEELGRTPTVKEMRRDGPHSVSVYQKKFGSWNAALEAAGLEINASVEVQRIEVECEYCGDTLERIPSQVGRSDIYLCDYECLSGYNEEYRTGENSPNWNGGMQRLTCKCCKTEYEVIPSRADESEFCSRDCAYAWRVETGMYVGENHPMWNGGPQELECENCGESFQATPSNADSRKYCSRECFVEGRDFTGENAPNWRGGYDGDYGSSWTFKRKEQAREQYDRRCQACGRTGEDQIAEFGRRLSVHHIIDADYFDDDEHEQRNALDNLIPLCQECHPSWNGIPLRPQLT